MTEFIGTFCAVSLPFGWQGERSDECDTVFNPEGVGALQISSFSKESPVSEHDLIDLASGHIESGAQTKPVLFGEFSGITLNFDIEGEYWRHWYLRSGSLALFVTYNCEIDDRHIEENLVNTTLNSLRVPF